MKSSTSVALLVGMCLGAACVAAQETNKLAVPWYVDNCGPATALSPREGGTLSIVYLHNNTGAPIACSLEYFSDNGVSIGPASPDNTFTIGANATLAFRPVTADPASVSGQENAGGQRVPKRPVAGPRSDGKKNGSIVFHYPGLPSDLTGEVLSWITPRRSNTICFGALLPEGVDTTAPPESVACSLAVPWFADNAAPASGLPPRDGKSLSLVYLHNNTDGPLECGLEYFSEAGESLGPASPDNTFTIAANATLAFRPGIKDPVASGGVDSLSAQRVPKLPDRGLGHDAKKDGSMVIRWIGDPMDVQGIVSTFGVSRTGPYAACVVLPKGTRK